MLKIGFDAKRLFHNFTGLGNYSRTLVRHLSLRFPGNEYHLYTPKLREHPETDFFFKKEDIKIHTASSVFTPYWRTTGIKKDLRKDGIQLYHGLSHEIPVNIHKTGIRSVVTIHDLVIKIYPRQFPWLDRQIYDRKFKYACNNADMVVAISESTKNDIVKFYGTDPRKIEVVYQTCHERFMRAPDEARQAEVRSKYSLPQSFILYVGSVIERKNLLSVVKALEQLPADKSPPLVIVGKGKSYLKKVKDYTAGRPVEKKLFFKEKVIMEDLPYIFQSAMLFVYPSVYEGFGIPVIEALFSGVPVITSPVSSLPEAGGPYSYYANPGHPEEIAAGIEKITRDTAFRQNMVEQGRSYVQKFSPEVVTTEMMNVYKSLV